MTLLQQLETALNKIYDGNSTAHRAHEDYESGKSHEDMYKCDCGCNVPLKEWNEQYKMCVDCMMEKLENESLKWGER